MRLTVLIMSKHKETDWTSNTGLACHRSTNLRTYYVSILLMTTTEGLEHLVYSWFQRQDKGRCCVFLTLDAMPLLTKSLKRNLFDHMLT